MYDLIIQKFIKTIFLIRVIWKKLNCFSFWIKKTEKMKKDILGIKVGFGRKGVWKESYRMLIVPLN